MKPFALLGAGLGLTAVLGGGVVYRPQLTAALVADPAAGTASGAGTATAGSGSTGSSADRQTVVAGTNPVTGATSGTGTTGAGRSARLRLDRSIMGGSASPYSPSIQLPQLVLNPPAPGKVGSITTEVRTQQFTNTADWNGQQKVDGPVRRLVRRGTMNSYVVVPSEPGQLHLLCKLTTTSYWVDSSAGEWRVHRTDGGPNYDFQYRFVRYDRSPVADQSACQ